MAISDVLLPEFDQEMAGARRTLERVPSDKFEWTPHDKSATRIGLAGHLANLLAWTNLTIAQDSLDTAPGGEPMPSPPVLASVDELLSTFDGHVAEARAAIAGASDEALMQP